MQAISLQLPVRRLVRVTGTRLRKGKMASSSAPDSADATIATARPVPPPQPPSLVVHHWRVIESAGGVPRLWGRIDCVDPDRPHPTVPHGHCATTSKLAWLNSGIGVALTVSGRWYALAEPNEDEVNRRKRRGLPATVVIGEELAPAGA